MGCRQIGGDQWGDVSEEHALETLHAANEAGITFYDTANIYGLGRSESLVAKFADSVGRTDLFLATKLGCWPDPGLSGNIAAAAIRKHTEASLARLKVDALNLTQLHCAPETLLEDGQVFETLRALQSEGKIRRWGCERRVDRGREVVPGSAGDGVAAGHLHHLPADAALRPLEGLEIA